MAIALHQTVLDEILIEFPSIGIKLETKSLEIMIKYNDDDYDDDDDAVTVHFDVADHDDDKKQ